MLDTGDTRPPADELLVHALDDTHRVASPWRRYQSTALRCRRGHLVAVVLGTRHGRLVLVRDARPGSRQRLDHGGWTAAWADEDGMASAGCVCDRGQNGWLVEVPWLAQQIGTLRAPPSGFVTASSRTG